MDMAVVQHTCPQNGHNVGSLFGKDFFFTRTLRTTPHINFTKRLRPLTGPWPLFCFEVSVHFGQNGNRHGGFPKIGERNLDPKP